MEEAVVIQDPSDRTVTKQQMLTDAGYRFHPVDNLWIHELLDRQLDGGIEQYLTAEQIIAWIKAGASRMSAPID
jgi:hypothetical protein